MIYQYKCDNCGSESEMECKVGKAPREIQCDCGTHAPRLYKVNIQVPNPTSEARQGRGKG